MKKTLTVFMCLTMAIMVTAQEKTKQKEVGLIFFYLDNFGLTYKFGNEKSLWRVGSIYLYGNDQKKTSYDSIQSSNNNAGFELEVGKEVAEKLEFMYGTGLSAGCG